jgi:hypothetical protein
VVVSVIADAVVTLPSRRQNCRAQVLLPLREQILAHIGDRAEESRYPLTPQRIVHDVRQVMPEDGIVARALSSRSVFATRVR